MIGLPPGLVGFRVIGTGETNQATEAFSHAQGVSDQELLSGRNVLKIVDQFPCDVDVRDPVFIELSDGVRLAARIWLPADADEEPVPAILEYLPYR
ncbi:MAG: CocE/NonD family hydrolase, partial [Geminicoccaceae bacterium]